MRDLLVACEVGLSVVLVVGAVLLVRSLIRLQQVDPGFNQEHVVTFTVSLPSVRYAEGAKRFLAFDAIERGLRENPAVQAVGATSTLALRGYTWTGDATVEGREPSDYERELRHESVTPGYVHAVGARLLAGRLLEDADRRDRMPVTLVNETLARRYFRGADAVGKRITFGRPQDKDPWVTIVGVVADTKQDGLDKPVEPEVYTPLGQAIAEPADLRGANVGRYRCGAGGGAEQRARRGQGRGDDERRDAPGRRAGVDGRPALPDAPARWLRGGGAAARRARHLRRARLLRDAARP